MKKIYLELMTAITRPVLTPACEICGCGIRIIKAHSKTNAIRFNFLINDTLFTQHLKHLNKRRLL